MAKTDNTDKSDSKNSKSSSSSSSPSKTSNTSTSSTKASNKTASGGGAPSVSPSSKLNTSSGNQSSKVRSKTPQAHGGSSDGGGGKGGISSKGGGNGALASNRAPVSNASPNQDKQSGSAPRQSSIGPGGLDALMEQLAAGTQGQGAAAADLLSTPGLLDSVVAAGFPSGALDNGLGDWLADQNDYRQGKIAERNAAGVTPSEGPIDWNAIMYDLNTPVRERDAASPTGDAFEGAVDWGGIASAIGGGFGGIVDAFNAPAPRLVQPPRDVPTNNGGLIERNPTRVIDPETGFVRDPVTGTYYSPDYAPAPDRLPTEAPPAVPITAQQTPLSLPMPNLSGFDALGPLGQGIEAEWRRLDSGANGLPLSPNMPRPRPERAGETPVRPAMAVDPWSGDVPPLSTNPAPAEELLPGMVPGATPIGTQAPAAEPNMWDNVVDMSGKVLENTPIGGIVKEMFPDMWYGAGETFKGNGGGGSLAEVGNSGLDRWGDPVSPRRAHEGSSDDDGGDGTGRTGGLPRPGVDFPDVNGNGIDDRLEVLLPTPSTPVPPGTGTDTGYDRNGNVLFPVMPPYNPGVDNEWLYFRRNGYAEGGMVEAEEELSPMSGEDPRMQIIMDAEAALEGRHPNPDAAIKLFIETFGEAALQQIADQIASETDEPRMVRGPGGPTDDAVPAMIDGETPAALSNGEFVMPADAVAAAGEGDPERGAEQLMALADMLRQR